MGLQYTLAADLGRAQGRPLRPIPARAGGVGRRLLAPVASISHRRVPLTWKLDRKAKSPHSGSAVSAAAHSAAASCSTGPAIPAVPDVLCLFISTPALLRCRSPASRAVISGNFVRGPSVVPCRKV